MIYIYSNKTSNRLNFILKFIFSEFLNSPYTLINSKDDFNSISGIKINYSNEEIESTIQIIPHLLLFENDIKHQTIKVDSTDQYKFFKTENGGYGFDLFSACFYLISRYEEYLPYKKDEFGRFPAEESLAFKEGFLENPIIDYWLINLAALLKIKVNKNFNHSPIIDIDNAFAYLGKGLVRNLFSALKDIFKGNGIKERVNTLNEKQKDPFDTYEALQKIHQQFNCNPIYFVLVGNYGAYDKNVPFSSPEFKQAIKNLDGEIGIHPSYQSNQHPEKIKIEKERLENITGKEVRISRQHYLKLNLPDTYNHLIEAGIGKDYSMAYPKHIGYRASTSQPFHFFDLKENIEKPILIHSTPIMDTTLNLHLKLNPKEAISEIIKISEQAKSTKGNLLTCWHNETISNFQNWKSWQEVYPKAMAQIHQ